MRGSYHRDNVRDQAIADAVKHGEALAAIGTRYGLTRERVRQIAARCGVRSVRSKYRAPWSQWSTQDLRKQFELGRSVEEIAWFLSRDLRDIDAKLRELGLVAQSPLPKRILPPPQSKKH